MNKLFDAIGEIDDRKIQDARVVPENMKNKKKYTIYKWSAAVAILLVAVVIGNVILGDSQKVVYASEYSDTYFWDYDEDSKVTINDAIKDEPGNPWIRVAIWARDELDAYEDLTSDVAGFEGYTQEMLYDYDNEKMAAYNNGGISIDDYRAATEKSMEAFENLFGKICGKELEFIKSIGGKDVSLIAEKNGYICNMICTIRKEDLKSLEDGKCKYVVVMYTKDKKDLGNVSLESYFGEYSHPTLVGWPLLSSAMPPSELSGYINISEDKFELSLLQTKISSENWTYKTVDIGREGFNPIDNFTLYDTMGDEQSLYELKQTLKAIYQITTDEGYEVTIYIAQGGLYIDYGLGGVYKFGV